MESPRPRSRSSRSRKPLVTTSFARARPVVVKADGLCAGKGVVVAQSTAEALEAIERMMVERVFGDAGRTIVIEGGAARRRGELPRGHRWHALRCAASGAGPQARRGTEIGVPTPVEWGRTRRPRSSRRGFTRTHHEPRDRAYARRARARGDAVSWSPLCRDHGRGRRADRPRVQRALRGSRGDGARPALQLELVRPAAWSRGGAPSDGVDWIRGRWTSRPRCGARSRTLPRVRSRHGATSSAGSTSPSSRARRFSMQVRRVAPMARSSRPVDVSSRSPPSALRSTRLRRVPMPPSLAFTFAADTTVAISAPARYKLHPTPH